MSTRQTTPELAFRVGGRNRDLNELHMVPNNRRGRKLRAELLKRGFTNVEFCNAPPESDVSPANEAAQ